MNHQSKTKQLTVISGKGGTGKSSIIASLAYIMKDKIVLADADVDAADLYLIFTPKESATHEYCGLKKAEIDLEVCTKCNICRDSCRFDAINPEFIVQPFKCEGCALCYHVCPESAVMMKENVSGHYFISDTRIGKMVHAKLKPGEESSGLLVAEVRKKANEVAKELSRELILIDGSPGIGCPVISSITGSDLALVVTEPTISGKHDLERVLDLLEQFRIRSFVIVNKSDINLRITKEIEEICKEKSPVIARIPHNHIFTNAMIEKKTVTEMDSRNEEEKKIQKTLLKIAKNIEKELQVTG
jgi:MinD superfamily P-loop ATPase